MQRLSETQYDAAAALWQGARDHQEDAVIADFPLGSEAGILVLADGMGGHAAGDIASKIVMTEVFSELTFLRGSAAGGAPFGPDAPAVLRQAADGANACIAGHIAGNPEAAGMGATLIAVVITDARLHWISVGDSLLYLFRDGELLQLNEDHSMAPQLDFMASTGMMEPETARDHPDRNALLSVLAGADIAKIDCPAQGVRLRDGDMVVVASDGILTLDTRTIERTLADNRTQHSYGLARLLLGEIARRDDPDQDNTSIAVVKVQLAGAGLQGDADDPDMVVPIRPRRVALPPPLMAEARR